MGRSPPHLKHKNPTDCNFSRRSLVIVGACNRIWRRWHFTHTDNRWFAGYVARTLQCPYSTTKACSSLKCSSQLVSCELQMNPIRSKACNLSSVNVVRLPACSTYTDAFGASPIVPGLCLLPNHVSLDSVHSVSWSQLVGHIFPSTVPPCRLVFVSTAWKLKLDS